MKKLVSFSLVCMLFSFQGCASTNGAELLTLLPGGNIVVAEIKNKEVAERHVEEAKRKEIAQKERDKEWAIQREQREAERAKRQAEWSERTKQVDAVEAKAKAEEARELAPILTKCNNQIMSQQEFLMGNNPYADKGKCIKFDGIGSVQMVSSIAGLFDLGAGQYGFIEFNAPFRGRALKGVAKLVGMHTYITRMGATNTVPKFQMLQYKSF